MRGRRAALGRLNRQTGARREPALGIVGADLKTDLSLEGMGGADDGDGEQHGVNLPRPATARPSTAGPARPPRRGLVTAPVGPIGTAGLSITASGGPGLIRDRRGRPVPS